MAGVFARHHCLSAISLSDVGHYAYENEIAESTCVSLALTFIFNITGIAI
ncbi:MAG: hypothetical protein IJS45_09065 [Clostridia bacterium]|nr:hypothetical protein [Clostridia bacterium]